MSAAGIGQFVQHMSEVLAIMETGYAEHVQPLLPGKQRRPELGPGHNG